MTGSDTTEARRAWMGVLARAPAARLADLWTDAGAEPNATFPRPAEIGTVMVRGRAGGTGAAFNLGEMTVTRATARLDCGTVGHAVVQGRDRTKARVAALADAMLQTAAGAQVHAAVIAPLAAEEAARRDARAAKAAATKVEFMTLERGED